MQSALRNGTGTVRNRAQRRNGSRTPAAGVVQEAYWNAVQAFNQDADPRNCGRCGSVHEPVELGDIAWPEVAAALRTDGRTEKDS